MPVDTVPYDRAAVLDTEEAIAAYLGEAFSHGDLAVIAHALGVVARARGMTQLAREAGLERAGLYKSLATGGNPELGTVLRVMRAMGMRLSVEKLAASSAKRRRGSHAVSGRARLRPGRSGRRATG
ncbi:MAG: putative addiction module antidote protein [Hyphomicrobiales bacterium]|nr:putative addiction module antidote protein [Hyphomicrobiales bacterium]